MDNAKKRGFSTNKTHRNRATINLFLICIVMLMAISMVSAMEFDNQKKVLLEKEGLAGYKDIEINNAFGLGAKLWSGTLDSNTENCGSNCEAIQTIELFTKGSLVDEVNFETLKNKDWVKEPVNSYKVYIQNGTIPYNFVQQELVCSPGKIVNGTEEEDCVDIKNISEERYKPKWQEYVLGTEMEAGTYVVRLTADKEIDKTVEWIYKTQGVTLEEWATFGPGDAWNSDLTPDLMSFYNLNEDAGTFNDIGPGIGRGVTNFTEGGTVIRQNMKLPNGIDTTAGYINSSTTESPFSGSDGSIAFWFQPAWNSDQAVVNQNYLYTDLEDDFRFAKQSSGDQYIKVNAVNIFDVHDTGWWDANEWVLFILDYDCNADNHSIWANNVLLATSTTACTNQAPVTGFMWGSNPGALTQYFEANTTSIMFFRNPLTTANKTILYSSGNGMEYGEAAASTVTLGSPIDEYNSSKLEVQFNASVIVAGGSITNMSLWHNGTGTFELNQTNSSITGATNFSYFNSTFSSDGTYLWNIESCNDGGTCSFGTLNRTFTIDTTLPGVIINQPTGLKDFNVIGNNETLNWTITDTNLQTCWYNYNNTNTTFICSSGITNTTEFELTSQLNLTLWANDSLGNVNSSFISWSYTIFEIAESHPDPVPEGSEQTFYINVTNGQASLTPFLIYNGTSYLGTYTQSGSNFSCERTLDIPTVTADVNVSFFWSFLMGDASVVNRTAENLTVNNLEIDNCTANSVVIMNLTLFDENNNTLIDDASSNIEIEVDIYSLDNVLIAEYNRSWVNDSNVSVCISNLTNADYDLYSTAEFEIDDYVHEFYFIDKKRINTTIVPINITFMDLLSADSTSFLFNYFDADGLTVSDPIVHTWRKYIGEGLFREVERSKQNDDGDTIVHLIEEDVIYYFQVSQNDTVIFTSQTYTALCDTSPCTITLQEGGGFQDFDTDWDLVDDGSYILMADKLAREINLTFETNTPTTWNLTVYKIDSSGDYEAVGSDEITGTSGSVSVVVPEISGNVSFFGVIEKDSEQLQTTWLDLTTNLSDATGTSLAIFLGILIILCLGLMAISEGSGTIVFVILGMFLTVIMGLINYKTTVGFGLLVYFVVTGGIIVWKLTRRNR